MAHDMQGSLLTLDNAVFRAFATYATVVIVKTMFMSFMTSFYRVKNQAFANPEDTQGKKDKDGKPVEPTSNPDVERVRRCHLNDLENVIPFVLIGLLYVTTGPDLYIALLHFRVFTVSRICHTIAYLIPIRQPARFLTFLFGLLATLSMAYTVFTKGVF